MSTSTTFDYVIVGGGVVGLTIAREIALKKMGRVKVIEKESRLGVHSSGRNSGVLHSGIYYSPGSLKATLCVSGARNLREYLVMHNLKHDKCGKVIVAPRPELETQIDRLHDYATRNGVRTQILDLKSLKEIEPYAKSYGRALFSPDTWTFYPPEVLEKIKIELENLSVEISLDQKYLSFHSQQKKIMTNKGVLHTGHLINAAGLQADQIAHPLGVGLQYKILPFRGSYKGIKKEFGENIKRLIYPVPDLNLPFLGVHITRGANGLVTAGPTATPAFGRENYTFFSGLNACDAASVVYQMGLMLAKNSNNMRSHVCDEIHRYWPGQFLKECQALVPELRAEHFEPTTKVGIRAQLIDTKEHKLVSDFILEKAENSTHVLNAVSPAFSSAFAFAELVCSDYLGKI